MTQERAIETGWAEGVVDDFLEALKVGFFAALEEVDEALGKSGEVVGLFEKTVALSDTGWFD